MKKFVLSAVFLGVSMLVSRAIASTVLIVGDSTVSSYETSLPFRGWGQLLAMWAKPDTHVCNLAVSGTSSKSFKDRGLWAKALLEKPNYVFIQFGHNDINPTVDRGTQPETTFRDNLEFYIKESRDLGAVPVLVTPPVRRVYQDGKLVHEKLLPYVEAMKSVGATENVPVVDLYGDSFQYFSKQSLEDAQKEVSPKEGDLTHFNERGATLLASMILERLHDIAPEIGALFQAPENAGAAH